MSQEAIGVIAKLVLKRESITLSRTRKSLINEYGWTFGDGFGDLDDSNYTDENLRHYLKYGDTDFQED